MVPGSGTGIDSVAAALSDRSARVETFDNYGMAVANTRALAELYGVSDHVSVSEADHAVEGPYDVVLMSAPVPVQDTQYTKGFVEPNEYDTNGALIRSVLEVLGGGILYMMKVDAGASIFDDILREFPDFAPKTLFRSNRVSIVSIARTPKATVTAEKTSGARLSTASSPPSAVSSLRSRESWLPKFKLMLVGLASVLLPSAVEAVPLQVEPGDRAAVVSVKRQGREVVATNVPGFSEVRASIFGRPPQAVHGNGPSLSEIRTRIDSTNVRVHSDLEAAGILSGRPVVVEINPQIFGGRSLDDLGQWFGEEVRAVKKRDPNAYFVWQGAGNPAPDVFLSEIPENLKNEMSVRAFRPGVSPLGARFGGRCVPVEIDEQSVPAFQALSEILPASGRVDAQSPADGYVTAYSTLAGARLSTQTLSDILEDRADLATQKQFSLKPTLEKVGEYLRYANLRLRMLLQAA